MATSKRRLGPPPAVKDRNAARNEELHRAALARGSRHALATERRRQQAAARAADPAAGGTPDPTPAPPAPAAGPAQRTEPAGTSTAALIWREGLTGWARRRFGSKS